LSVFRNGFAIEGLMKDVAVREPASTRRRASLPWIAAGLLLVAVAIGWYLLPVADWLGDLRGWIVALGFKGVVVFAMIYIVGAVVLAPEALLTIAAGFAYGAWGFPIVLIAATIGASLAFLIARHVARDKVRLLLAKRRNLAAIDKAVAEDGWKIVVLLRLSPLIPFNLQNYLFGVTAIPFRHFVAATFFGIAPGTALYVYLGVLGNQTGSADLEKGAFLAFGLVATIVVAVLVARKARAILRAAGIDDRDDAQ
jgi:uncharacterized membrane protein YdjX (TVP38/TMEM64 family)